MQKQFRGANDGLRVEPLSHRATEQSVGDGDDRHPLMVSHERMDDRDGLPF